VATRRVVVKGLPLGSTVSVDAIGEQGWNVLAGDTSTPVAVLRDSALTANLASMRAFCAEHDVELAPHAKTHMSPQLCDRQLAAGAWGLTVAVPHQVQVVLGFGARRLLVANEITDQAALRWLAGVLRDDPGLEIVWYVDSATGVRLAADAFGSGPAPRLLLEVGHPAGRTGVRTGAQALAVGGAVAEAGWALAGVAGYEGTIGHDRSPETRARVSSFLSFFRDTYVALDERGLLVDGPRIVTAGGSVHFDLVAEGLAPLRTRGAVVVLRSGCYLTHDHGVYQRVSPTTQPGWAGEPLVGALEVWGRVLSRPEPQLALLNLGRRDVGFDLGLPVPIGTARDGRLRPFAGAEVSALGDQHAWLRLPAGHDLAVGDLVGVGVSHPCTTFDKWQLLLAVDDAYDVLGAVRTCF
jgi:D-serine dehydratase